jgi:hypothetical protein
VNAPSLTASSNYFGTAMSADGKYILIIKYTSGSNAIFFSSNNGVSFAALSSSTFSTSTGWQCCAMSSTGQIMVVAGLASNIYKSTDYGVTWAAIGSSLNWQSLQLSYSGQYCIATSVTSTNVYSTVFSNFLVDNASTQYTIFTVSNPGTYHNGTYVSKSGKYMGVLCYGLSNGIATSTNYGVTWATSNYGIGTPYNFGSVTINYDETKIYICVYSGTSVGLYIIPISGNTIGNATKIDSYTNLGGIASVQQVLVSRDGTYIIISNDTKTYYSRDSGVTWLLAYTGQIQFASMSEGAKTVISTSFNNEIPNISKT